VQLNTTSSAVPRHFTTPSLRTTAIIPTIEPILRLLRHSGLHVLALDGSIAFAQRRHTFHTSRVTAVAGIGALSPAFCPLYSQRSTFRIRKTKLTSVTLSLSLSLKICQPVFAAALFPTTRTAIYVPHRRKPAKSPPRRGGPSRDTLFTRTYRSVRLSDLGRDISSNL
jgi:hypothetical protein